MQLAELFEILLSSARPLQGSDSHSRQSEAEASKTQEPSSHKVPDAGNPINSSSLGANRDSSNLPIKQGILSQSNSTNEELSPKSHPLPDPFPQSIVVQNLSETFPSSPMRGENLPVKDEEGSSCSVGAIPAPSPKCSYRFLC